ncbi:hypothetical protein OC25_26595 [Pedobacter kyungheensis]|uniref:Lipocalin-like domain-containing protein n=1 Tax=Pedobacter kyungheensis TaxID=1069985 RepID=A0A0C1CX32_9SPHI|nr:lipocalin family protein [Pedobacter kyungheensis]KIA86005.1 hypothetical protein OC25_26595 [Pedobacter kyungheensis]
MKKLFLAFTLLTLINLSSCKKDETTNTTIVGKWQIDSYVITNFENTGKDQDDTKGESPRPTLEFKEDGNLHAIFYFKDLLGNNQNTIEDVQVKYTVNGDKLNLSGNLAFNHNSFTFSITNNTLILKRTDVASIGNKDSGTYTENTTVTATRIQ